MTQYFAKSNYGDYRVYISLCRVYQKMS